MPISDPIPLRGHTLLCLQGFRGEGYDAVFIDRLTQIHKALSEHPDHRVEVVQGPDGLCAFCPHLQIGRCQLNGPDSETDMQAQDADVMARLAIDAGTVLPWKTIQARIGHNLRGADLHGICGGCRWLALGYCREGIERLNKEVSP